MNGAPKTLAELLKPYNLSEVGRLCGRARNTVHAWGADQTAPDSSVIPRLAEVLRVDIGTLTEIIANDAKRRRQKEVA